MHLRGAGIGETDIHAARDQGPHQTFRTVHGSTPVRLCLKLSDLIVEHVRRRKALPGIAAIAAAVVAF
jgi:hypothetical protein